MKAPEHGQFMADKTKNKMLACRLSPFAKRRKLHIHTAKLLLMSLAFFMVFPSSIQARTFNPHNLLTDQDLFNGSGVSVAAIQAFLVNNNSVLARYSQIVNGRTLSAAEIISEIGRKHNISPKYLLAILEKEQSLISRMTATEKALDWATGYGCFGGGCQEKHRGFYNQVEAAAETQEIYRQKKDQFIFQVGKTATTIDGFALTPQNQATANQYIYTPYVGYSPELGVTAPYGGNRLFWRIWSRYFTPQKFVDGQIVRSGDTYYLIAQNAKRRFVSKEIFLADYSENDAIVVGQTELNAYPDGPNVAFPNNTLVRSSAAGQLYLLSEGVRRPIVDEPTALALLDNLRIALDTDQISTVDEQQLAHYPQGALITAAATYPQGKLFRGSDGQVWLVQDNLRHLVYPEVWRVRYSQQEPADSLGNLESLPTGEAVKFRDGTFVVNEGKYYVISQGERMKIEDPRIFDQMFGPQKRDNAVVVSAALLEVHGAGEIIEYMDDTIQDTASPSPAAAPGGTITGQFIGMQPDGLVMLTGQTQSVSVQFSNTGGNTWQRGAVQLQLRDRGAAATSFGVPATIDFSEASVSSGQAATFTFNLTAPTNKIGLQSQDFVLTANGATVTSIGKFVIVKPSEGAEVVEHNLPVAVRNTWRPIAVTLKLKNTSQDMTWLSRKTALEVYDAKGGTSQFYDANDWVRPTVAAVPINGTTIKPGAVGEFKFTIDPRGIPKGTHSLIFKLRLLDKDKQVVINGGDEWTQLVRVD